MLAVHPGPAAVVVLAVACLQHLEATAAVACHRRLQRNGWTRIIVAGWWAARAGGRAVPADRHSGGSVGCRAPKRGARGRTGTGAWVEARKKMRTRAEGQCQDWAPKLCSADSRAHRRDRQGRHSNRTHTNTRRGRSAVLQEMRVQMGIVSGRGEPGRRGRQQERRGWRFAPPSTHQHSPRAGTACKGRRGLRPRGSEDRLPLWQTRRGKYTGARQAQRGRDKWGATKTPGWEPECSGRPGALCLTAPLRPARPSR